MAVTITIIDEDVWGKTRTVLATILLDTSYPTNGYTSALGFKPAAFGLKVLSDLWIVGIKAAASGIIQVVFDYSNIKLLAFRSNTAAHSHDALFIGGITATEPVAIDGGDTLGKNAATNRTIAGATSATKGGIVAASAAQASLVEVSNAINLSTVTVMVRAFEKNLT